MYILLLLWHSPGVLKLTFIKCVCLCLSVCVCVCLCVCLCVAMHVWCGVEGRGVVSGAVQFHGIVILRYCYAAISLLPRFQCRDINIIAIFTNS